jgi:hypothetical protein
MDGSDVSAQKFTTEALLCKERVIQIEDEIEYIESTRSALEYSDISFGLLDRLEDIQLFLCFRVVLLVMLPTLACYGLTLPVMFDYVKRQDIKGLLKAIGSI